MIKKLSVVLADSWARMGIVKSSDVQIYQYGMELLFSTLVNVFLIIVISIMLGYPWLGVPYLLSFIPLRAFAGGYHAKTHWLCFLVSSGTFWLSAVLILLTKEMENGAFCFAIGALALINLMLVAPVQANNKPLTAGEARTYRNVSLRIGTVLFVISVVALAMNFTRFLFIKMLFCGEAAAISMMIAGHYASKKNKNREIR